MILSTVNECNCPEEHGKVREAEMRMEVVNRKRGMSLPDSSWRECEDKRGAEKEGLHD